MPTTSNLIVTSRSGNGVLLITLDRPGQFNAFSAALLQQTAAVLIEARSDPEVRCVVLTGNSRAFSAGADIKEMQRQGFEAISNHARQSAWQAIEHFPKPMIAAVRGICFGGGLELAMLADIIIAAEDAVFSQP